MSTTGKKDATQETPATSEADEMTSLERDLAAHEAKAPPAPWLEVLP